MSQQPYENHGQETKETSDNKQGLWSRFVHWLDSPKVKAFGRRNRYTILFMLGALLLAISFFTLGFWKTIFVLLLLFVAYMLGGFLDRKPRVFFLIDKFRRWMR